MLPADDHYEVLNHAKTTVEEEEVCKGISIINYCAKLLLIYSAAAADYGGIFTG